MSLPLHVGQDEIAIRLPSLWELERRLSAAVPITERVAYGRGALHEARYLAPMAMNVLQMSPGRPTGRAAWFPGKLDKTPCERQPLTARQPS